ncbi:MAG: hypothetical protein DCC75_03625 [Proteobacteria bacterium]|nr:MAG: hypothetical protein DCC75_03625 [Pseudomonadota bacterium]
MLGEFPVTKVLSFLDADDLLPAILFRTSRKQCDADLVRLMRTEKLLLTPSEQSKLNGEIHNLIYEYQIEKQVITGHTQYDALVTTGVGAHHAGQLLIWRLLLEELMSRGCLKLMIATGTVAAGVDFPARSVVITAHSKRGAEGFRTLSSSEFQQMSGRAGRRGKDTVGFCFVAPGPFSDARVIHDVAKRPPEPLRSAYFASPSTILNLLKFRSVDDLNFTVQKSLGAFLDSKAAADIRKTAADDEQQLAQKQLSPEALKKAEKRIRRKLKEAEEVKGTHARLLSETLSALAKLGYVTEEGSLSEKGFWAAHLCTNLVLQLGEAINDFLIYDLPSEKLVGLVASIAGDPHRSYLSIRRNPIERELFEKLAEIVKRVKEAFGANYSSEIEVVPDAAVTVITWMESKDWIEYAGLLRLAGVAEGDAARLIMQTAEHLGQISRLYETHAPLATQAAEVRRRLLKPPLSDDWVSD